MNDATKARDAHLIASMAVVLTSGFAIENGRGIARIERDGDGYRVLTLEQRDPDDTASFWSTRLVREHFDDLNEAIRYYLDACDDS
jgi:hypothetical protein